MHAAQYVHYHFMLHALVCFVRKLCGKKPGLWQSAALAADPGMLPADRGGPGNATGGSRRTRECYRHSCGGPGSATGGSRRPRECYRHSCAGCFLLPYLVLARRERFGNRFLFFHGKNVRRPNTTQELPILANSLNPYSSFNS